MIRSGHSDRRSSSNKGIRPRNMLDRGMSSSTDQNTPVVEQAPGDSHPDTLTSRALRLRIRQQELLAELGVLALQGTSFIGMLQHRPHNSRRARGGILQSIGIYTGREPPLGSCWRWLG